MSFIWANRLFTVGFFGLDTSAMKRDYCTMKKTLLLSLFFLPLIGLAQDKAVIELANPSFEDVPKCCEPPKGWFNCGSNGETAPDVQPGSFQVNKAPNDGQTYLGLVVRDNETWEAIGQRLPASMEQGKCYEFSIFLARAELYLSLSRTTGEEVNYATPVRLRLYGGNGFCDKRELLAQSAVIKHDRWIQYNFMLKPKKGNYSYLVLEAYYNTPILFPYNGNVLMDNASAVREIDCDPQKREEDEKLLAEEKEPQKETRTVKETKTTTKNDPTPVTYTTPEPEAKFNGVRVVENSVIQLDKIYFDADKFVIREDVKPALKEIYDFLLENPKAKVEIGGHTNNVPKEEYCDSLSTNRAKAVSDWLISKGIPSDRVQYKGYGKRNPIANNKTEVGRKKNQRVEIKILSLKG